MAVQAVRATPVHPASSLSLEDDLMRIFGGERVQNLMDSLGLDEDVPIENKLITNTIESAQKSSKHRTLRIRKQVLQYDDVMNQQREIIYKQRQMVLDGEDISGKLHEMMRQSIDDACAELPERRDRRRLGFRGPAPPLYELAVPAHRLQLHHRAARRPDQRWHRRRTVQARHGYSDREGEALRCQDDARVGAYLPAAQC